MTGTVMPGLQAAQGLCRKPVRCTSMFHTTDLCHVDQEIPHDGGVVSFSCCGFLVRSSSALTSLPSNRVMLDR